MGTRSRGLRSDANNEAPSARSVVEKTVVGILNAAPAPVAGLFRSDARLGRLVRPWLNRLVPSRVTEVVVRSGHARGLKLLIDPRTEKFYWTGAHEVHVQDALVRLLRPGMTFWDVGAHIGFFTLLASRLVGAAGEVHAFEPLAENRSRLEAAVRANGCENVVVHELAVAERSGEVLLYGGEASVAWSLRPDGTEQRGVTVSARTLDELARALRPPDVLKIDVEQVELDVLRGGAELLSAHRPAILLEAAEEALAEEARALVPSYALERLGPKHWLLA